MLMVLSQPLLRQRHAVHVVTPTCSSHRDRLTTAAQGIGYVLPFDSIFTRHILPRIRWALAFHTHGISGAGDSIAKMESVLSMCQTASEMWSNRLGLNSRHAGIRTVATYWFWTGHALPLAETTGFVRELVRQIRGATLLLPELWTWPRPIPKRKQPAHWHGTRFVRVREQAATLISPRKWLRV